MAGIVIISRSSVLTEIVPDFLVSLVHDKIIPRRTQNSTIAIASPPIKNKKCCSLYQDSIFSKHPWKKSKKKNYLNLNTKKNKNLTSKCRPNA